LTSANRYNDPTARFVGEPAIGDGTWIGPFCLIDGSGGLVIGRGCDIAGGVHIYTHSTARRCVTDRNAALDRSPVRIGNFTFIGANSVILMGVTIGDHCIVGAGSVVTTNLPDHSVTVGAPARVVGTVNATDGTILYLE
jgi:acetyltransferase-like isoleucine patch superfamily enzyme